MTWHQTIPNLKIQVYELRFQKEVQDRFPLHSLNSSNCFLILNVSYWVQAGVWPHIICQLSLDVRTIWVQNGIAKLIRIMYYWLTIFTPQWTHISGFGNSILIQDTSFPFIAWILLRETRAVFCWKTTEGRMGWEKMEWTDKKKTPSNFHSHIRQVDNRSILTNQPNHTFQAGGFNYKAGKLE